MCVCERESECLYSALASIHPRWRTYNPPVAPEEMIMMYVVGVKASMMARNLLLHTCAPCAHRHQVMPRKTKLAGPGLRRASCRCRGWLHRLQAMPLKTRHARLLRHA